MSIEGSRHSEPLSSAPLPDDRASRSSDLALARLVADGVPSQIALLDSDGIIIFVNAAWRRFATANGGSDADFCVGRNYLRICDSARGECAGEAFRIGVGINAVLRHGAPSFTTDYPCHSPTQERWFRIVVTPVDLSDGRGAVVSHVDVTDLKQAQDKLQGSEARLERAQAMASTGSWQIDVETGHAVWSRQMYLSRGVPLGTTPTRETFLDRIDERDRAAASAWLTRLGAGETVEPLDLRLATPNGERMIVSIEGEPVFGPDGRVVRIDGTERIITAQRLAERADFERLMHAQKIRALAAVAGGIAHELNNALVPIISMADLCLDAVRDNEDLSQNLELILQAGLSASFFVKKIMALGRDSPRGTRRFSLEQVIDDVVRQMREVTPPAISVRCDVRPTPLITGDPVEIHQVLLHLITNAIEAIGSRAGQITVALSVSAEGPSEAAPHLVLAVSDNGPGIDAAAMPRIFEPFFSTRTQAGSGGLGLAIVHGIVSSHGGTVDVTSEPVGGARFVVKLPLDGDMVVWTSSGSRDDGVARRPSARDLGCVE